MSYNIKCTFCFEQGGQGWTESLLIGNQSSSDPSSISTQATALAAKRAALSGSNTTLRYLRCSTEGVSRDVFLNTVNLTGTGVGTSANPDVAVIVRKRDVAKLYLSTTNMRGLAVGSSANPNFVNGNFVPAATWVSAFGAWLSQIITDGWGFISKNPTGSSKVQVSAVTSAAGGQVIITTAGTPFAGLAVGTKVSVNLSQMAGCLNLNGPMTVVVSGNSTCQSLRRIPIFTYAGGGSLNLSAHQFVAINTASTWRTIERRAGKPLFTSRGRSANRQRG